MSNQQWEKPDLPQLKPGSPGETWYNFASFTFLQARALFMSQWPCQCMVAAGCLAVVILVQPQMQLGGKLHTCTGVHHDALHCTIDPVWSSPTCLWHSLTVQLQQWHLCDWPPGLVGYLSFARGFTFLHCRISIRTITQKNSLRAKFPIRAKLLDDRKMELHFAFSHFFEKKNSGATWCNSGVIRCESGETSRTFFFLRDFILEISCGWIWPKWHQA